MPPSTGKDDSPSFYVSTLLTKVHGKTSVGINKYKCKSCNKYFCITTGTIFQNHKIPISEWIECCLALFRLQSFNAISKSNRNSYTTTKYWITKIRLTLKGYQDDIVLSGKVYIDETFYKVKKGDIEYGEEGKELRGLSRNQMCIGVGCDGKKISAIYKGIVRTSKTRTKQCFLSHIAAGSHLVHDEEDSHNVLLEPLKLTSEKYNSNEAKKLPDDKNPLDPINKTCLKVKNFLNAHKGFKRDEIHDS